MLDWRGTPKDFDCVSDKEIILINENLKGTTEDILREAEKECEQKKEEADRLEKMTQIESMSDHSGEILVSASVVFFDRVLLHPYVYQFFFCASTEDIVSYAASVGETLNPSGGDTMKFVVIRQFGIPGVVFICTLPVAALVMRIMREKRKTKRQKEADDLLASAEETRSQALHKIEELEKEAKSKTAAIEEEKKRYRSDFEKESRAKSIKYANSSVANEVIEMISTGFKNQIDACDRRPHVKEVIVPLSFKVYAEKIETPYGVYDFEIQRVAKLPGMKEQTALANAVAQSVHTDVFTTYPNDVSGGEVKPLEIGINYGLDWVEAVMTYRADNANYIPERSF